MKFVLFYHSLISDWNHGNAHFLRGVVAELLARSHGALVFEPRDAWSVGNLVAERGAEALDDYRAVYSDLRSTRYDADDLDLDAALDGADVVLVHEWNGHDLVARIGAHRAAGGDYKLLFHDTHHRAVTERAEMELYDLRNYDGVLAFGEVIRELYQREGWTKRAWTWHEGRRHSRFSPA